MKTEGEYTPGPFTMTERETPKLKPSEVTPKNRPSTVSSEVQYSLLSDSKGGRPENSVQNRPSDFTFKHEVRSEADQLFSDFSKQADNALMRRNKILESKKKLDQIKQRILESKAP
jgi:hypothetical protein